MKRQAQVLRPPVDSDPARCPLCGGPNDCQHCTTAAYKGPCWCESAKIPDELLARVPLEARNRACLCRACVAAFHREQTGAQVLPVVPGDFYFEAGGLMVFTAAYHLRRGYCCGSNCRHCPYREVTA
jgi:hypothetical protein